MSVVAPIALNDLDLRVWQNELDDFVPLRVYDAHTHIYRWAFNTDPIKETSAYKQFAGEAWSEASMAMCDAVDAVLFPGRKVHRLAFPYPFSPGCDFEASNEFIAQEVASDPDSAGLMLVRPEMSADEVERQIIKHRFLGLKPYRFYSVTGDVDGCRITDFMAEHQIELANKYGLLIMMHVSKRDAIADEENIVDMVRLCEKYPNVRWILAHCARSYSSWAIERAASRLRGLPNVWYDTSSVCESDAFDALYSEIGVDRVMYGSDDVPVGVMRGKYIAFGRSWAYLSETNQTVSLAHCDGRFTFVRYEQLRAMRAASRRLKHTREQNDALFFGTAMKLITDVRAGLEAKLG